MNHQNRTEFAWRLLYYTYGLFPIVVGIDKFFNYIVDWNIYLNPSIPLMLGLSPFIFLKIMGIIEIGSGLLVFYRPRLAASMIAALLVAIIVNLLSLGKYYDIAIRDMGLAVGAVVLALLSNGKRDRRHQGHDEVR